MKRLIKSELYDSFNEDNKYYEIFINPTPKEISDVKKQDEYKSIRGVIYENGDVYIWCSNILHDQINNFIKNSPQIDINQFRFVYVDKFWTIDAHDKYSSDEVKQLLLKYKDILSNFGNTNSKIMIAYVTDSKTLDDDEFTFYFKDINKTTPKKDLRKEINKKILNPMGNIDFIRKYINDITAEDWKKISDGWAQDVNSPKISEDFIREFQDKVNWYVLKNNKKINLLLEFKEEFKDKFN